MAAAANLHLDVDMEGSGDDEVTLNVIDLSGARSPDRKIAGPWQGC